MASSEKFSGGRSNFSQTCSLLSQYLKEKGSFGELTLGLTPNLAAESKGTMNLLPKIEKSVETPSTGSQSDELPQLRVAGEESLIGSTESGQMTIFYGGQVLVFNDFPAEKVKEIVMLASKSIAGKNHHTAAFSALNLAESATGVVSSFAAPERARRPQPALPSDLPIARKNSLARFLAKRRDRNAANAPYQVSKLAPVPVGGNASAIPDSLIQGLNCSYYS